MPDGTLVTNVPDNVTQSDLMRRYSSMSASSADANLPETLQLGLPGVSGRLNTGIPPTPVAQQKRLAVLAGDFGGFPNGRRPVDDVVDIASRAVAGILADSKKFGTPIGDGVNINPEGINNSFPYLIPANSGRDSHHIGPGQEG